MCYTSLYKKKFSIHVIFIIWNKYTLFNISYYSLRPIFYMEHVFAFNMSNFVLYYLKQENTSNK